MKKTLRLLLCLAMVITIFTSPYNLFAQSFDEQTSIISEYYGEEKPHTIIKTIDENLVTSVGQEKSFDVRPMGTITEQYSHTTYTIGNEQIRQYSCGPITDQKFILSVARGKTETSTTATEVKGSVTYSGSVGVEIKKLINIEFTGSATGEISKTWTSGLSYVGPPEGSPYNSRQYYVGIDYDLYNVEVTKCDVYKTYNGSIFTGYQYYYSTVYVNDLKRPKAIEYSKDFMY